MQHDSIAIRVALAPLRAIEQTRGWRRLGLLVFYAIVALTLWALLWRRSQLAALPDVGEPFDVAGFRAPPHVSDDRNAVVAYRAAARLYRDLNAAERASFTSANLAWSRADATLSAWVAEHDEAISLLEAGSARPECVIETPSGFSPRLHMENSHLVQRIPWIGTAGLFKAGRLRAEGDPARAWALLKAIVRASRHIEWAIPRAQGRTVGIMLVQYAREPVADWARDPATGAGLLHQALDDLAAAEALTPPLSRFYRREYLNALELLKHWQFSLKAQIEADRQRSRWPAFALALGVKEFLEGEPERSRRVLNLLIASDLVWCDRPLVDRPAFAVPQLRIPEHDPATPAAMRAIAPEALAHYADSALITPALAWRLGEIDQWEHMDRRSLAALTQAVAVALYTKEMGNAPASAAQALKRYRPMPGDSPNRDEAKPLR